jgi:hypothetical protein
MLAPEDLPGQHARVMRVTGPATLAPPVSQPETERKVGNFEDDYASSSSSSESSSHGEGEDADVPVSSSGPKLKKNENDGWGVVAPKKKSQSSPPSLPCPRPVAYRVLPIARTFLKVTDTCQKPCPSHSPPPIPKHPPPSLYLQLPKSNVRTKRSRKSRKQPKQPRKKRG